MTVDDIAVRSSIALSNDSNRNLIIIAIYTTPMRLRSFDSVSLISSGAYVPGSLFGGTCSNCDKIVRGNRSNFGFVIRFSTRRRNHVVVNDWRRWTGCAFHVDQFF
jgi:hypothetical protein